MNWSRTKTWLIVLFVGINLFLIITLIRNNIALSTISEQTVQDTVAVLERNGISVDAQIMPKSTPVLSAVEVLNTANPPVATAEKLLGGAVTQDGNRYLRGTASVRFDGDTFYYDNPHPATDMAYTTEQEALEQAKIYLTNAGFDISKAQASVIRYKRSETQIIFTQKLDSYPLLDSKIYLRITPNGIREMEGCWFYMSSDQRSGSGAHGRVKPVTSILIDFINDPAREQTSTQIVNITLGYTTGDKSTYHKSVSAMPSWCITTADGYIYYYDAR